jgi:hypothetical protein
MNKMINNNKILLVPGFDPQKTKKEFLNGYIIFKLFFKESNYNLDIFNYSNNEDIITVYTRLEKYIKKNNYNIILSHSMGGALVFNYCYYNDINNFHKIIFIAPLICKIQMIDKLFKIPFISNLSLPKAILLPNSILFEYGNILNDSFNLVPVKQIYQTYKCLIKDEKKVINLFNKNENMYLIYMNDEHITVINDEILEKIKNKKIIRGKHGVFFECSNLYYFFCLIKKLL